MNLLGIFKEIEKVDPEVFERLDTRRSAMKEFGNMSKKAALAALPLAFGGMLKKAYGQSTSTPLEVLQYALTLEILEFTFYNTALNTASLAIPTGAPRTAIETIRGHEQAHVAFLQTAIRSLNGIPVTPTIDLTGGNGSNTGPFAPALSDYQIFLAVAQAFEDTGVRAYKGQVNNLISDNALLTAAVQIHSVEARHASHIRQMRSGSAGGGALVDPWINGKQSGISAEPYAGAVQAAYNGEEVTTQASVNITSFPGVNAERASEAFDEVLTMAQVLAIIDPFIA